VLEQAHDLEEAVSLPLQVSQRELAATFPAELLALSEDPNAG
jgi:hypothetical protein